MNYVIYSFCNLAFKIVDLGTQGYSKKCKLWIPNIFVIWCNSVRKVASNSECKRNSAPYFCQLPHVMWNECATRPRKWSCLYFLVNLFHHNEYPESHKTDTVFYLFIIWYNIDKICLVHRLWNPGLIEACNSHSLDLRFYFSMQSLQQQQGDTQCSRIHHSTLCT